MHLFLFQPTLSVIQGHAKQMHQSCLAEFELTFMWMSCLFNISIKW